MKLNLVRLLGWMDFQYNVRMARIAMAMLEWQVRLLNVSFDIPWTGVCPCVKGRVTGAFTVPLYKGKGDKCDCTTQEALVCCVVGKL